MMISYLALSILVLLAVLMIIESHKPVWAARAALRSE